MATTTYVPIASQTLGSAASTVTFSSISQSYTDLIVVFNGSNSTSTQYFLQLGNGSIDTGSNYSTTVLDGNGSSAASGRYTNDTVGIRADYYGTGGGNIKQSIYQIQNYSNTTTYKTVLVRSSLPATETVATVGLWRSTSAINTIRFSCTSGNYDAGSTFTLYGIAAGAAYPPTAKATGGTITYDVGYTYHTFTSSGTFTPSQELSADILVIGGGGGGAGAFVGGGGGAGSVLFANAYSLNTSAYSVTIGGGGSGGSQYNNGVQGTSTSFSSLAIANGGGRGGNGNYASGTGTNGGSGGSGGGGGGTQGNVVAAAGGAFSNTSYTSFTNYGFAGGSGAVNTNSTRGGGGGGAGQAGENGGSALGSGDIAGTAGGAGLNTWSSWLSTTSTGVGGYIAGGGGGGQYSAPGNGTAGAGGAGGGGAGGGRRITTTAGATNTGSGGGGAGEGDLGGSSSGAAGGSGLVIVRYAN